MPELAAAQIAMDIIAHDSTTPFITADGSEIRELLNAGNSSIRRQSLAEATVGPGGVTLEHYHPNSEEIYYILEGMGRVFIERVERVVVAGDAIAIPPGHKHKIANTGSTPLVFLCCCAPGYSHEDTVLTGN
jgi:mannose-6-phosphate isomerase-like protein (cupin superfamily)